MRSPDPPNERYSTMSIYDIAVSDSNGTETSLREFEGSVLLIVNTATKCGFTPQYKGLQSLYDTHAGQGLEILDFPCNQFLNQAPGSNEAIEEFCSLNYATTFRRFAKIDVNGKNEHPLYAFLKANAPKDAKDKGGTGGVFGKMQRAVLGNDIKWNFTKFLVGRDGTVVARFGPTTKPEDIEAHIARLI